MKGFDKVYPFTTEKISSYFPALNLADKSILTVGSSCDQVFNALVCGAGRIVVYDIEVFAYDWVVCLYDFGAKHWTVYHNDPAGVAAYFRSKDIEIRY